MNFSPRPYQSLIVDHILQHPRSSVWAGMGMGKTVSTLTALDAMLLAEDGPVLVVAPLRVAQSTWPAEARKWNHLAGLRVSAIVGTLEQRLAAMRTPADIYTTNYEQLPWLVERWGKAWPYRIVVLDESTKVKGFRLRQGTQRARALGTIAHTKIERIVLLTGTPSPNGLQDLWGQQWFVDAGERLGRSFSAFEQRWFRKHFSGFGMVPLKGAQDEIQSRLKDVCITVRPEDWFDLREPIVNNIEVELPPRARRVYNDLERDMFVALSKGDVEALTAASLTIKCLQLANGAVYVGDSNSAWEVLHDEKIQALESVIEEAAGAPVLVAYHFKSDLARLRKAFPRGRELDKDPKTIEAWNAGDIPVLFAHPASAGHGLNLQDGGNILAFFGHWWNLEERLQILERIGPVRQLQAGHDRSVFIHNIVAKDTVDELVMERVATKREVQDILLDAMKVKQ